MPSYPYPKTPSGVAGRRAFLAFGENHYETVVTDYLFLPAFVSGRMLCGSRKLTEGDRKTFFSYLEGGTIKEPEDDIIDGDAGPWTYIYRGNGQEEYVFPSYGARLAFEEYCEDRKKIGSDIFDFFSRVSAKLVLDLKKPFQLVDMVRVDETPMHDSVREALVNCLVNTDFYEPRGVVVEKYPDRIEFRNPGTSIVGKKQMLRGGESEPRNGNIMKMFNLIGYGERAGSGVPDIYAVWNVAGYVEPIVEEQFGSGHPNRTIVTLPLVTKEPISPLSEKSAKKGAKREEIRQRIEAVYNAICENPAVKNVELESIVGASKRQIERALKTLQDDGRIHREEGNRQGKWII